MPKVDYQHNEGFCGGFSHQFSAAIAGRWGRKHESWDSGYQSYWADKASLVLFSSLDHRRCGICGDAWDANPREHEVTVLVKNPKTKTILGKVLIRPHPSQKARYLWLWPPPLQTHLGHFVKKALLWGPSLIMNWYSCWLNVKVRQFLI